MQMRSASEDTLLSPPHGRVLHRWATGRTSPLDFRTAMRREDKISAADFGSFPYAKFESDLIKLSCVVSPRDRHLKSLNRYPVEPAAEPRGDACRAFAMTSGESRIGSKAALSSQRGSVQ